MMIMTIKVLTILMKKNSHFLGDEKLLLETI